MKYELAELLKVRNYRKKKASDDLLKANRLKKEAQEKLSQCDELLKTFLIQKPKKIDLIYKKILLKKIKRNVMDVIAFEIFKLDEKQSKLELDLKSAQNKLEEAERYLKECKDKLIQETKGVQKIEEHREIWLEEAKKIEDLALEKEVEDISKQKTVLL